MYKCVFGENLVKIAPQELLVAAEATPQSWQASQTSVWLGLNLSFDLFEIHNLDFI